MKSDVYFYGREQLTVKKLIELLQKVPDDGRIYCETLDDVISARDFTIDKDGDIYIGRCDSEHSY